MCDSKGLRRHFRVDRFAAYRVGQLTICICFKAKTAVPSPPRRRTGAKAAAAARNASNTRRIDLRCLARSQTHFQIVGGQDRRVACDLLFANTARNCFDHRVRIRVVEKGDRVPFPHGPIDDTVRGRDIDVVGPTHQAIADIDDKRAGNDWRSDPLSVAGADLKPSDIVSREQREVAVIGMLARAGGCDHSL